jgi:hypothetical protein
MKPIRFFLPRLEYILFMALFWSIAANGPRILNFDGDLPRHLLLGRLIRETGSVPLTDTFSFRTVGYPSIPHEWLSQVLLSISNDILGLSGVVLLTALIVTVTWIIVYFEARRRSNHLFALLFVTALGFAASMIHVLPRPHLFTYLFTAFWIVILERIKADKPRSWWWLPILMIVWVNLHGMFVLGIILWGIYLAGSWMENPSRKWFFLRSTKNMLLGGGLSLAATFLSPSGFEIWDAVISLGSNTYITSRIPEYQSANFHLPGTWPFILLLLLTITAFARTPSKTGWTYILLTLSFTGFALYTSRMIPLFAIVIVPVAARAAGDWFEADFSTSRLAQTEKNITLINASSNGSIWMLLLLLAVFLVFRAGGALDPGHRGNVFDARFFPVQAVDWLHEHPQNGPMFNEFDWGGYLLLKLSARQQIFMDGHTHIYGEALTREYETVTFLGNGWQEIMSRYQIKWAIVRAESPIAQALKEEGWMTVYDDDTSTILRKFPE